jgi:hypothetical protein
MPVDPWPTPAGTFALDDHLVARYRPLARERYRAHFDCRRRAA